MALIHKSYCECNRHSAEECRTNKCIEILSGESWVVFRCSRCMGQTSRISMVQAEVEETEED